MSNVGFLITARLKSTRLPLKLLAQIDGVEVIRHVIRRAKKVAGVDRVILCTSANRQDFPLIEIAKEEGIFYSFGSEVDVLDRLGEAATIFGLDSFVSMTGDNPAFCVYHATRVAELLGRDNSIDYAYIEGLPIGAAVYGLRTSAVKAACEIKSELDTEIWGPFVNRPDYFSVFSLKADAVFNIAARLTVDYPEDYQFMLALAGHSKKDFSSLTLLDIGRILLENPGLVNINGGIVQRGLSGDFLNSLDEFYSTNEKRIRQVIEGYKRNGY